MVISNKAKKKIARGIMKGMHLRDSYWRKKTDDSVKEYLVSLYEVADRSYPKLRVVCSP